MNLQHQLNQLPPLNGDKIFFYFRLLIVKKVFTIEDKPQYINYFKQL